jgi:hypothetical protein
MATTTQVATDVNYVAATPAKEISVDYNETSYAVTVSPEKIDKDTCVRFKNPKGGKLRIVFLSPTGKETDTVTDSDTCTLTVGGFYHFKCFFTPPGSNNEISPKTGGVIDVIPHRP